jgi:hypothetical protein
MTSNLTYDDSYKLGPSLYFGKAVYSDKKNINDGKEEGKPTNFTGNLIVK